jgi:V8-like Glu-specific endopeptidase
MSRLVPRRWLPIAIALLVISPAVAAAQTAPMPERTESISIHSARFDGGIRTANARPRLAYTTEVAARGAPWLRLVFGSVELGKHSYLVLTSLDDGASQRLDAAALRVWQNTSAYFNGDAVWVELYVAPGDGGVHVDIDRVVIGEIAVQASTICGPADDRTASSDRRVGRIASVGCTGWLISTGVLLTAGHCVGGSMSVMELNVPRSASNGGLRHPGPEDQYPIERQSIVHAVTGPGNDWAVFRTARNAQTGLTPHQAQGAAFTLAQSRGGASLTVTGYGTDSGADNQSQQTHSGPAGTHSGNLLRHRVDSTGGNSGSPIIDVASGHAIGIHTHGGCGASGGNNNGTSTFHPQLWAAAGGGGGDVVRLHEHCGQPGWSASFAPGSHTLASIVAAGGRNDDASSVSVPAGYRVTLYEHDNFGGRSVVFTGDRACFVADGFNDLASSLIVERVP